jgi:hypothetical protein
MSRANRPGTLSLVLGLAAVATAVFVVGVVVGLVGLGFGIVGLARVHRGRATNLRAAAAGTVLSGVAMLASVGLVLQVGSAGSSRLPCSAGSAGSAAVCGHP